MRIETPKPVRLRLAIENRQSKIENRQGFTLIELLLVVAIISILAALTASIVSKAFYAVKRSSSERLIQRVYERITKRYGELAKQAEKSEPGFDAMLLAGGGADRDRRRARVIQLKLLQKWNFPMNYKEAWAAVTITFVPPSPEVITGHPTAVALYKTLRQRLAPVDAERRSQLLSPLIDLNGTPTTNPTYGLCVALDPYTENAGCLALIYEHLGSADELTTSELIDTDGDGIRELVDAFGNPLRFYRWPTDYVDDTPGNVVVADQLYPSPPAGLVNSTRVELAFEKANQDADDRDNLLYDQSWFIRPIQTPFGGQYFAVDIFEGRASNNSNAAEHLWLKRMSFHRVSRQRQDQNYSPRTPRAVYAPLVIVSAGVDKEFGLLYADRPETGTNWPAPPYGVPPAPPVLGPSHPFASFNDPFFLHYWLKPDRMIIFNQVVPEPDGPTIVGYAGWSYLLQRQREFDNVYSFRARLNVEGQ